MKLLIYESEKVYNLEGEAKFSNDPFAGSIIYGCYGVIILPKWLHLSDDSLNRYRNLLERLRIERSKGIDYTVFGHIELRDYIGPGGTLFTLSTFFDFLNFLSRPSLDVNRRHGLFIPGDNFSQCAEKNIVWRLYEAFGLLGRCLPLRGVGIEDTPEHLGLRIKLDDFPLIRIFIKFPVPLLAEHQVLRSPEYEFLWDVDLKEVMGFYRSRMGKPLFSETDLNYLERIRDETLRALALYLNPLSLSPLMNIIVTIWRQHHNKMDETVKRYREKLSELCKNYEVIYISNPEKPLETILNESEKELIEQLTAKGLKYRGKVIVD